MSKSESERNGCMEAASGRPKQFIGTGTGSATRTGMAHGVDLGTEAAATSTLMGAPAMSWQDAVNLTGPDKGPVL
jgi:hypothetical protein